MLYREGWIIDEGSACSLLLSMSHLASHCDDLFTTNFPVHYEYMWAGGWWCLCNFLCNICIFVGLKGIMSIMLRDRDIQERNPVVPSVGLSEVEPYVTLWF